MKGLAISVISLIGFGLTRTLFGLGPTTQADAEMLFLVLILVKLHEGGAE